MGSFLTVLEWIGTLSFALSGAMIGYEKRMDLFGVSVLGLVTACGGGLVRDLLLGRVPPLIFTRPAFPLAAMLVAASLFLPAVRGAIERHSHLYEMVQRVADSVGLGAFTAAGVSAAMAAGFADTGLFFTVFIAVLTACGGGVLRDVLAGLPPYIFVKHIYACAAIAGAILCALLWQPLGAETAMAVCVGLVFAIRMLAAKYRWSLPRAAGVVGK